MTLLTMKDIEETWLKITGHGKAVIKTVGEEKKFIENK